jgi:SecD/SecF fusion protein
LKKSVTSFIAVMLVIVLLGVTAVTGLYIPGGWSMPFRNTEETTAADDSADTAEGEKDADAAGDSASDETGEETDESDTADEAEPVKAIIPSIMDTKNGIRLGLDLVGGSRIVYEAELPEGYDHANLADDMESVQKIIRQRLTYKGFTEATVTLSGENRVTVEIPQITNPEEAVQTLGSTAQLTFRDADNKEWLSGTDVKKAVYAYGRPTGTELADIHYVQIEFTSEGRKKFAEATKAVAARSTANGGDGKNVLFIVMDDQLISYPSVSEAIDNDSCVITGNFTQESATELANLINGGQIPFSLKQIELRSVGPQLGANAMQTSLTAGAIGILLVCLFMLIIYRVPGLVACLALGFYIVLEAIIFSLIHVNLSLPGIAGILLSIGMAVDANVIIFERIKEELRAGKTVKSAIESGFKRAFAAILDSNITTLIAAAVLFWKGTGTIVGFATTLGIGVIISMFTALTVTHFLLNRMVDFRIRSPKAYGLREQKQERKHFPILKNFKIYGIISILLVATGLVALLMLPTGHNLFNLSIDFAGGTEMEFNMNQTVTQEIQSEVAELVKETAGVDASVTSSGDKNEQVLIRSTSIDSETREKVIAAMEEKYGLDENDLYGNEDVSASVGSDLQQAAFISAIVAIVLMLIYITIRFELTSGLAAVCCLVHDLLIMLSVYVWFQIPLDTGFIAAALTILGYSINASIIVFDRIRENLRTARKEPFEDVAERSVWQTMGRTINTTLTTLFTVGMIFLLGVPSLKQFTLPLIIGIIAGAWSSIMLSSSFWAFFRKHFRKKRI